MSATGAPRWGESGGRVRAWKGPILCWIRAKKIISAGLLMRILALTPTTAPDFGGLLRAQYSLHSHLLAHQCPEAIGRFSVFTWFLGNF